MDNPIVLGLSNNIDYEILWDSRIFEGMIRAMGIESLEIDASTEITGPRDLLRSILGFFKSGTGGECYPRDPEIIESFAQPFKKIISLGGTSVRAAIAMNKLGFKPMLHLVTMNEHVSRLLPQGCSWICTNSEPSMYPHLIVQYNPGDRIDAGDIHLEATRANRIICTCDEDNARLRLHPGLTDLLSRAKVFLLSGFNAMQDAALLDLRLSEILAALKTMDPGGIVFFEDACFRKPELNALVRRRLLPVIDIYSMNEDELKGYLGRDIPLDQPEAVAESLHDVGKLIPGPVLVLHTRTWALAYGTDAQRYRNALAEGIAMATSRFRFGDTFSKVEFEETRGLPPEEGGRIFSEGINALLGEGVCCVPSIMIPESSGWTVGLGDSFVGGFLPSLL